MYTPDAHTVVIELENENKINAVIQDIQFHPVSEKILHVDFFEVFDDKEVKMIIPVKFEGNSQVFVYKVVFYQKIKENFL